MTTEQGKPLAEAAGEVEYAAASSSGSPARPSASTARSSRRRMPRNRVLVLRQPVGVTAAITPWNFPAAMMTRKLGPAMAAGCTSIVKPASATPLTAALVLRAIEDAGAPPGVVNLDHLTLVRDGRRDALRRPPRPQGVVHRLHRGRQGADPAVRGPGEAALARARRPCARTSSSTTPRSSRRSTA